MSYIYSGKIRSYTVKHWTWSKAGRDQAFHIDIYWLTKPLAAQGWPMFKCSDSH